MSLRLEIVVQDVRAYFEEMGLHRVRVDRWCLEPDPRHGSWYVEIGTSYGEVAVRLRDKVHRIHKEDDIEEVMRQIENEVLRERHEQNVTSAFDDRVAAEGT